MPSALADPPALWVPEGPWVPPRYATPRDLSRQSTGPAVAKIARALGQPLMPWQLYTAAVGGEVNACGLYVFPLVIVSVPRQSGKTTLALAQAIHRCLQGPNRRAWFTAQTGQDSRDKFRELVGLIMASPVRQFVQGRPRLQTGSECLTFLNGSTLRPHPPTRDALHGKQSDHNDVDEGWSFDEPHGVDLFQAITPTQATRPGAQTWVWSTRGDASSVWFHGLVDRALSGAPGVAGFDWGIPDEADPLDVDVVAAHHPALGHIVTRGSLEAAQVVMADKPAEYARAYGNRATGGRERIIPEDAWAAARTVEVSPAGRPTYGVAVWEPRNGGDVSGALVAAVAGPDGVPVLEVVEARPGRAWLVDRVLELRDAGQGVAVRRKGPAGTVADALELAGVQLLTPNDLEYGAACQDLWDRLCDEDARRPTPVTGSLAALRLAYEVGEQTMTTNPRVRHRATELAGVLDSAVDVAGRRFTETGAWVWSAKLSTGDVAALEAATLATWGLARAPAPVAIVRSGFL